MIACLTKEHPPVSEPAPTGENEFAGLARGMRTDFLATLLGVTRQMVNRYRSKGAPPRRVAQLRSYLERLVGDPSRDD